MARRIKKNAPQAPCPRPYRLGQRQAAIEQTRGKIIRAARELIISERAAAGFTIEAVARQAGVARMTVYNQFGSKIGLLEALFDDLAARGQIDQLANAFRQSEPRDALNDFIAAFARFWSSDRLMIRRLHAMIALDAEMAKAERARQERRRKGLRVIVGRLREKYKRPVAASVDEVIEVLFTLTSFETFDSLAGTTQKPQEVARIVRRLAWAALGLQEE